MGAMDTETRRAIALFRFGVLGALVSARLEHGDRKALFAQAAERDWVTPDGRIVRISSRPARCEDEDGEPIGTRVERRSFIAEHVGDLWVGDALHVHRRVLLAPGRIGKAYLLSQIDSASRYVPHSYFAAHEQDVDQEHGLQQAILKYGTPRVYYVDRGPAYVAGSLSAICAELSCRLVHAGKRDAEAKGVIERGHRA